MVQLFGVIRTHTEDVKSFVLIELRSINQSGNPVAGAKVSLQGKDLGVTDSFGEWRRYLRLSPSQKLTLTLTKRQNGKRILRAMRKLQVPKTYDKNHDKEIKATLELRPVGHATAEQRSHGNHLEQKTEIKKLARSPQLKKEKRYGS